MALTALERMFTEGRKGPVKVALTGGRAGSRVERDKELESVVNDLVDGRVGVEEACGRILRGIDDVSKVEYVQAVAPNGRNWLDVGARARREAEDTAKDAASMRADFVVHPALAFSVEGSGPLPMLQDMASDSSEAFDVLCRMLIGRGTKAVLAGSVHGGLAVWDVRRKRGAYGSTDIPFTFSAFKDPGEVKRYLGMLAFRSLTLDSWMMMRGWTIGSQDEIEQTLQLRGARSAEENSLYIDRSVLYASQHCSDPLREGVDEVRSYPGGVALEVLADMGKMLTFDGRDVYGTNVFDLISYELNRGSLDLGDRDIMVLLNAMRKGGHDIASREGSWVRVTDLRDRSIKYPVYGYNEWVRAQLERPLEEIWADESLPAKVRRKILILPKLGFQTDVLYAMPMKDFLRDGDQVLREFFLETGESIGVNSALMNEVPEGGGTPRMSFGVGWSHDEILEKIRVFGERLASFKPSPPDPGDYAFLYSDKWVDSVGFAIRFDGIPPLTSEMRQERAVWTAELQKGQMPRYMDPVKGNHINLSHHPIQVVRSGGGDIEIPGDRHTVSTYSGVKDDDHLLMAAEGEIRRRVESFGFLRQVATLMKLVGRRSLALEGMYTPSGEFFLIDFSFSRE